MHQRYGRRDLGIATTLWLKAHLGKEVPQQGPCIRRRHQRPQNIFIIRSRCREDMTRIIMRVTRLDSYDNHHRRKGEEDKEGIRHQEQEPNDIEKETRLTTSTRTSSIIHHIVTCAISHGSRATTTCLCGLNDIISFILDYLDSSRSSNGQHQSINIKQQRQTDNINIKQKPWLNIKDPQPLHIKVLQQNNIKPLVGDSIDNHHYISLNQAMPDINDTESTSSGLITQDEANIMSSDINMLAVSQPRLPTPTPFDGSSPPFQEWASELRTFLDINERWH